MTQVISPTCTSRYDSMTTAEIVHNPSGRTFILEWEYVPLTYFDPPHLHITRLYEQDEQRHTLGFYQLDADEFSDHAPCAYQNEDDVIDAGEQMVDIIIDTEQANAWTYEGHIEHMEYMDQIKGNE